MEVTASARYIRIAPRKVSLVADFVRGLAADKALIYLAATKKRSCKVIEKLIKSALSNVSDAAKGNTSSLYIGTIRVDGGPALKRFDSRAMGRAEKIKKRMSHISLTLTDTLVASRKK